MVIYIETVTGAATVDHMVPRSAEWSHVYEWSNYRLACSLMNSRKKDAVAVLDPFQVEMGWFELEFVGFQVRPGSRLARLIHDRVERTIVRLRLNDRECCALREAHVEAYERNEISLEHLKRLRSLYRLGATATGAVEGARRVSLFRLRAGARCPTEQRTGSFKEEQMGTFGHSSPHLTGHFASSPEDH